MADWQNLDPEAAREAEKYENPIPSRELILAHLSERGAPATRSQLLDEFGLAGEEPEEALRRRLRAMERDGQLIYTRRGAYAPVDKLDLIRGRISGHRDGRQDAGQASAPGLSGNGCRPAGARLCTIAVRRR